MTIFGIKGCRNSGRAADLREDRCEDASGASVGLHCFQLLSINRKIDACSDQNWLTFVGFCVCGTDTSGQSIFQGP